MEYAVFLRAINVGRANRVRMERLRAICGELGWANARTHVQTGNIVLDCDAEEESLALALEAALVAEGLRNVSAMVRSRGELEAIVAAFPVDEYPAERFRRYVTFFREPIDASALVGSDGLVRVLRREVLTAVELGGPPGRDVNGVLSKAIKAPSTTRYWNVAADVLALMSQE